MNRNFYLVLGAGALIALAACTVKEDTDGDGGNGGSGNTGNTGNTGGTGGAGNSGNTGGGGGGSCYTCNAYLTACISEQACPDGALCAGAAETNWQALADCVCTECLDRCPGDDPCPGGTAGAGGGSMDDCATCQGEQLAAGPCTGDVSTCMGS